MRPPCFTAVYGAVGMTIVGMSVGLTAVLTGELESEGSQAGVALSSQAVRTIVSSAASHAPPTGLIAANHHCRANHAMTGMVLPCEYCLAASSARTLKLSCEMGTVTD